jgi:hypothetical protein
MTVSAADILKASYNAQRLLGDKAVASDAMMVIDGEEQISLLLKQFPWPVLTPRAKSSTPRHSAPPAGSPPTCA